MNLHAIDWLICLAMLALVVGMAARSRKYTRSVADFLAADRSGGRYLLCVSGGMAKMGAVAIIGYFEMYYEAGFTIIWWSMLPLVVAALLSLTGWLVYRYRETRAMTLAQFFEMRYSRRFRVFAGILAWVSGIVNFGIFPAVGARFFIHFCGLPSWPVELAGLHFDLILAGTMSVLLAVALALVFFGGQVTVMVTDFVQGVFLNIAFLIILANLFWQFDWSAIIETLQTAPEDASMINPFRSTNVESFNYFYFLITAFSTAYLYRLAWQGEQGNACSAKSAHEAKMAGILGEWRTLVILMVVTMLPLAAYTVLHNPEHASLAQDINDELARVKNEHVRHQVTVTVALSRILPPGVAGLLCASVLAAFVSTHDTYLHSWGSILIQDVVLPLRNKPLTRRSHLLLLRGSIALVAVAIFLFSLFFPQNDKVVLFLMISAAIFMSGAGAVIIGGLYWKHGSTLGAWTGMLVGALGSIGGIIASQMWPGTLYPWLVEEAPGVLEAVTRYIAAVAHAVPGINWQVNPERFPFDSQWLFFFSIVAAIVSYVLASLFSWLVLQRPPTDMDRLLHRGRYAVPGDHVGGNVDVATGWRALAPGDEFTTGDRLIYYGQLVWSIGWIVVFVAGTIYNLAVDVPESSWATYWKWHVGISMAAGAVTVVWFSIGGLKDMSALYAHLAAADRDPSDDGTIAAEGDAL